MKNKHPLEDYYKKLESLCIASDCMMWREYWVLSGADETLKGYCGLAGRPE